MSKTKKGFLNAGAIISIVLAVVFILLGVVFLGANSFINKNFVVEAYKADPEYRDISEGEEIKFEYVGTDQTLVGTVITGEDIEIVVTLVQNVVKFFAWILIILAVLNIVLPVLVFGVVNKESDGIGSIIGLLIVSVLSFNFITMAFMITALCLKNKPKENAEQPKEIEA